MKENNGDGQIDRDKLEESGREKKLDITAEILKLYQNDPISNRVIHYLLSKYKIVPINAIENIRLHREEILLNIVNVYKQMWDARGKIMLKAMQSGGKPIRITIKEREKDGDIHKTGETKIGKENGIDEGISDGGKSRGEIHKKNSDGK